RDATHIPLKLTTLDPGATKSAGAHCVFLQGRATFWAMQCGRLGWRRRQNIAFAFQVPALPNVITHFRGPAVRAHHFGVVCFKEERDVNSWSFEPAHVGDMHAADYDSLHFFQVFGVTLE